MFGITVSMCVVWIRTNIDMRKSRLSERLQIDISAKVSIWEWFLGENFRRNILLGSLLRDLSSSYLINKNT
jgi:hypothetical protein